MMVVPALGAVLVLGFTCFVVNRMLPPWFMIVVDFGIEACIVPGWMVFDEMISILGALLTIVVPLPLVLVWIICTVPGAVGSCWVWVLICVVVGSVTDRTRDGGLETDRGSEVPGSALMVMVFCGCGVVYAKGGTGGTVLCCMVAVDAAGMV